MFNLYHLKRKKFLLKRKIENGTLNGQENERLLLEKFKAEVATELNFLNKNEEEQ